MSTNRLTPFTKRSITMNNSIRKWFLLEKVFCERFVLAEILGQEQIDLTRLKKQAQLTQTSIPKTPRITRTLKTLESVLKVLEEHSRKCKHQIDELIQSVANENHQLARVNSFINKS